MTEKGEREKIKDGDKREKSVYDDLGDLDSTFVPGSRYEKY